TFALNAAECVRRVIFVISSVPLPTLSLALAPAKPLIRLSEFSRPPLLLARAFRFRKAHLAFHRRGLVP
ncbi:hypothetical protein, partial [Burkholderia sp. SIMBA_051]|uniref:hypothetical protein n=1 Tax=Burkholderia sp. SIMBA_051 TaxID=3085792 RepID=UPI00397D5E83